MGISFSENHESIKTYQDNTQNLNTLATSCSKERRKGRRSILDEKRKASGKQKATKQRKDKR